MSGLVNTVTIRSERNIPLFFICTPTGSSEGRNYATRLPSRTRISGFRPSSTALWTSLLSPVSYPYPFLLTLPLFSLIYSLFSPPSPLPRSLSLVVCNSSSQPPLRLLFLFLYFLSYVPFFSSRSPSPSLFLPSLSFLVSFPFH